MDSIEFHTPSGVRLREHSRRPGALNWLLLPGGPGIGSESLIELADALTVGGTVWLVDLPGDGSNPAPVGREPYADWPGVLMEAALALPNPVYVGHSTGGMYLLTTPGLEDVLAGMALVSSAPHAGWKAKFIAMTQGHPLPEVDAATAAYEREPTIERLRDLAVASAPWNFGPDGLDAGRDLLVRMPYCPAAVAWSDVNFDDTYAARWKPASLPTLIVSGGDDRIVDQDLWAAEAYTGHNLIHRVIDGGAHFPWIERPAAVGEAFDALEQAIGL